MPKWFAKKEKKKKDRRVRKGKVELAKVFINQQDEVRKRGSCLLRVIEGGIVLNEGKTATGQESGGKGENSRLGKVNSSRRSLS